MKKLLVLSMITLISFVKAQNKEFEITDDGLTKYVVTEIESVTKEVAYKKTIDWVNREFNTPDKVIKGTIENEYVRIEGISKTAMRYPAIGGIINSPIKFEIEISVKDNKYKFEIISLQEENYMYPRFATDPFMELNFAKKLSSGYNPIRKSNGDFRNRYKFASDVPLFFNNLNKKLQEYILGTNKTNDNW